MKQLMHYPKSSINPLRAMAILHMISSNTIIYTAVLTFVTHTKQAQIRIKVTIAM